MNSLDAPPIRLFLELDRDDDPHLYDELSRFRKGPKRVNRLRLLAHDGLQIGVRCEGGRQQAFGVEAQAPIDVAAARLTGHAFELPDREESDVTGARSSAAR